jgi:hypothetical protein
MTIIKFTVDSSGDNIDAMVEAATKEAREFYKDLPGTFRVKDISVSYDAEYHQMRVQRAIDEAEARVREYADAHPNEEGLEVVPAHVNRYSGWIEFEYDTNQSPKKPDPANIFSGNIVQSERTPNPAEDPKYQDPFQ